MKTIETKLYSFAELSEEAKQTVLRREAERVQLDYVGDEMLDSLRAVAEACGFLLHDYSFGPYCQNWKAKISGDNQHMEGNRALAYFLRVLVNHGYARPKTFREMTFPGVCGFTGVCYDDEVCETIWRSLLDGKDMSQAFNSVAGKFCRLWEDEEDYRQSDAAILEYLDQNAEIYTKDGEEF
jgi:hypothetical protein